jgi:hypothetical protein
MRDGKSNEERQNRRQGATVRTPDLIRVTVYVEA